RTVTVDVTPRIESRRVPAGTLLVKTAQPLGSLAVCMLEPASEDGLATWNFFEPSLQPGKDFPIVRLPAAVALTVTRTRPLLEDRTMNKPIGQEPGGSLRGFSGSPV